MVFAVAVGATFAAAGKVVQGSVASLVVRDPAFSTLFLPGLFHVSKHSAGLRRSEAWQMETVGWVCRRSSKESLHWTS